MFISKPLRQFNVQITRDKTEGPIGYRNNVVDAQHLRINKRR